jgi:hypothetical protein
MPKFLKQCLLISGLVAFFYLPIMSNKLNNPVNAQNQKPLGIMPQEMGREKYLGLVRQARETVARMPPNTNLMFSPALNYPVRLEVPISAGLQPSKYRIIGYVTLKGEPRPMTAEELTAMFDYHLDSFKYSHLPTTPGTGEILVADASGQIASKPADVVNLLLLDTQSNQVKFAPNVVFVAILTYATNAALTNALEATPSSINVSGIDPNKLINFIPANPIRSPK